MWLDCDESAPVETVARNPISETSNGLEAAIPRIVYSRSIGAESANAW
jgi:hypothetical protein